MHCRRIHGSAPGQQTALKLTTLGGNCYSRMTTRRVIPSKLQNRWYGMINSQSELSSSDYNQEENAQA